jgi:hypothetical protein
MLSWIIQITLISIIFIFLVHHILVFFKSTLTVPKIKDLVNSPNQKYQNIYDTISHKTYNEGYTDIDLLPSENYTNNETTVMKDELKSFLKKQLNVNNNDNNNDNDNSNIIGMNTMSPNFSNF